ncbi:hypothetical protein ERO13_A13G205650v2 [Gossypium hirsutum]|nr:hypothetical protein ERO13_A13G205650v2 [Gossypium hirsutum]
MSSADRRPVAGVGVYGGRKSKRCRGQVMRGWWRTAGNGGRCKMSEEWLGRLT